MGVLHILITDTVTKIACLGWKIIHKKSTQNHLNFICELYGKNLNTIKLWNMAPLTALCMYIFVCMCVWLPCGRRGVCWPAGSTGSRVAACAGECCPSAGLVHAARRPLWVPADPRKVWWRFGLAAKEAAGATPLWQWTPASVLLSSLRYYWLPLAAFIWLDNSFWHYLKNACSPHCAWAEMQALQWLRTPWLRYGCRNIMQSLSARLVGNSKEVLWSQALYVSVLCIKGETDFKCNPWRGYRETAIQCAITVSSTNVVQHSAVKVKDGKHHLTFWNMKKRFSKPPEWFTGQGLGISTLWKSLNTPGQMKVKRSENKYMSPTGN